MSISVKNPAEGAESRPARPPKAITGPIVAIQEILVNAGVYPKSMVDGQWGDRSEKALRDLLAK